MSKEAAKSMLAVDIAGIKMKTPVIAASGTFGFGEEYEDFIDWSQVGAISVKGLTREPRLGNPGRRVAETPAGMLNSVGLQNPGIEAFVQEIMPRIQPFAVPIIVNINGNTVEDYACITERLEDIPVAAIEVNISCPNTKHGCMAFGVVPETAAEVVREVKRRAQVPVIVKLSPNVTDITAIACAVEAAGADAISLINTLLGMAIDTNTWQPMLGNVTGGLSGPAVKPVAVRMVWQTAQAVKIPIIGMGGITGVQDAVEFFLAGASAVQVGTGNFLNPRLINDITAQLPAYLAAHKLDHISQMVGRMKTGG
ncbi:MAG: pyrD [Firmicutes bacterium]|nr:pyrD [Bacillota bacterium]